MVRFLFNPFTKKLDIASLQNGPGPMVETLTGNSGGPVGPDSVDFNINILGGAGITIVGDPSTNTLTANLNNYSNQTVTTTNATPNNTIVLPLGSTPGVYTLDVNVSAFNVTDTLGAGFSVFSSVRTTGSAAVLIDNSDLISNTEGDMSGTNCTVQVTGNDAVIQLTGLASKTIDWRAIIFYTFVS